MGWNLPCKPEKVEGILRKKSNSCIGFPNSTPNLVDELHELTIQNSAVFY